MTHDALGPKAPFEPARSYSTFSPHGQITATASGRVVRVIANGPFNLEGIALYSAQMSALYGELPAGVRFVNISEVRGSLTATPEAWDLLGEHLRRVAASPLKLVATACVLAPDLEGRRLFLPKLLTLFANAGRPVEAFADMAAAEEWAQQRLAKD